MKSSARIIGFAIFLALASEAAAQQMLSQSKIACLSGHRIHSSSGNPHRRVGGPEIFKQMSTKMDIEAIFLDNGCQPNSKS